MGPYQVNGRVSVKMTHSRAEKVVVAYQSLTIGHSIHDRSALSYWNRYIVYLDFFHL